MKHQVFRHVIPRLAGFGMALILAACASPTTAPVPPTPVPPTSAPTQPPAPTAVPATVAPTTAPTAEPTAAPGIAGADIVKMLDDKFNTVDRDLALWNIQPGLGTVMIEYGNRISRLWFAANSANWDMAKYQLDEMIEIQEVGETTRPNRAPMLKAFEENFFAALNKAIDAKDKAAFTKAFDDTITGCNACHAASTGDNWAAYQFVHIQVPKTDPAFYVDWKGGGQDNYIANPPAGSAATPTAVPTGNLDAAGVEQLVNSKFNTVDRNLALWNIQPGLGTVMIEYGNRFSRLYFAAKSGNWDMAKYQLGEMIEIQEVGETTRPNRAPMLKAFEENFFAALDKAIDANDAQAFDTAYTAVAEGCNACHTASSGTNWKSYQFVKIQVPTADNNDYIVWKADKPTGNYIANPASAATATPSPALTGVLDTTEVENLVNAKFNNVDRTLALWNIQPGLGTVMIEYGRRLAQIKYAIDAGNWDMAKYQLDEALEIQEVGEITRPNRAPMLKAFEDNFLKALDDAILAQDNQQANTALTNFLTGCNACHTASQGTNWSSYAFVQIQLPKTDPADYLQWNTQGGTGNYKP
jgi:cytochrome c553